MLISLIVVMVYQLHIHQSSFNGTFKYVQFIICHLYSKVVLGRYKSLSINGVLHGNVDHPNMKEKQWD